MKRPNSELWFTRLALFSILSMPVGASAQMAVAVASSSTPEQSETDKTPGFSIRKEQRPVLDAFEDFERFRDKKAWEKAFAALAKIDDGKPGRLVLDKDGFYIPTDLRIRAALLSLPPDGREAYRLFNDARARKLLADLTPADGSVTADEIPALSKLVNRYFITAIGDQAADRLGDALFETGDFANAQRCWALVIENYPDSSLPAVLLQTKRAIACVRAGDFDQYQTLRAQIHERYAGQFVHIAGKDSSAVDVVDALAPASQPSHASPSDSGESKRQLLSTFPRPVAEGGSLLPASDRPAWQMPIMDEQACAQLINQLSTNGWGAMATQFTDAVPATAVDEKRVYVNWLGICFALDLNNGKLVWRTDSFGGMPQKMAQSLMQGISIDPDTYSTTLVGDKVLFTRRNTDNQDYNALPLTRLWCLAGDTGKTVWKSDSGNLSAWGFVGQPMIKGDVFYTIAHAGTSQDLTLVCIGIAKGDLRWRTDLGTPAATTNWRGQPSVPTPALLLTGDKFHVLTNNGVILQVDGTSHQVDWAFSYPTYIPQQQQYYGWAQPKPIVSPGAILSTGSTLYFKEYNSNMLFALDPTGPTLKWKRRIDSEAGLAGVDNKNLILAGPEVECVDLESKSLQWDAKTSMQTPSVQPLVQGDWMYMYGSRGIDSVRLSTGETGPRFRGADHESNGGVLWKTSTRLVTVSNRAITAYPLASK